MTELPDLTEVLGVGAYEIGDGLGFGQGITEQSVDEIVKLPAVNLLNPIETLIAYLRRLPVEALQMFSGLFPEDLQDNFDNAEDAIALITESLVPLLNNSFWDLVIEFFKFLTGGAQWDDVEEKWGVLTETLEDLNIESGRFWGEVTAILVSPWVSEEFADGLANVILVYFQRTQDRVSQEDLEAAVDDLLALDPESDFWRFALGIMRLGGRLRSLADTFFEFVGDAAEWDDVVDAWYETLDIFGIQRPSVSWFDSIMALLPQWVKDLNGFLTKLGTLVDTFFKFVLGTKTQADLTAAWNDFIGMVGLSSPMPVKSFVQELAEKWIADMFSPASLEELVDEIEEMFAQIGDIFDDIVVTPINSIVALIKDWWDNLWTPKTSQLNSDGTMNASSIMLGSGNTLEMFLSGAVGGLFAGGSNPNTELSSGANNKFPSAVLNALSIDGDVTRGTNGGIKFPETGWYSFHSSVALAWNTGPYMYTPSIGYMNGSTYVPALHGPTYANPSTPPAGTSVAQCTGLIKITDITKEYLPGYSLSVWPLVFVYVEGNAAAGTMFFTAVKVKEL